MNSKEQLEQIVARHYGETPAFQSAAEELAELRESARVIYSIAPWLCVYAATQFICGAALIALSAKR